MPSFREGLSFDDVLLVPKRTSVLPSEVDTSTVFLPGIVLKAPIVSAPMDTVTDARLAIAMAREGGVVPGYDETPVVAHRESVVPRSRFFGGSKAGVPIIEAPPTDTPSSTTDTSTVVVDTAPAPREVFMGGSKSLMTIVPGLFVTIVVPAGWTGSGTTAAVPRAGAGAGC